MKFTEEKLEQAFIELLCKEKIPHVLGQEIQREPSEVGNRYNITELD